MRKAGAASWKVTTNHASQLLHAVLFVRDSLHLTRGPAATAPPRLAGEVPDLTTRVGDVDLAAASDQWPDWWNRIVQFECAVASGDFLSGLYGGGSDPAAPPVRVFDPPEFVSLDGARALQSAARALYREALHWRSEFAERELDAARRSARSAAISRVVNEVSTSEGIPADALVAVVLVVDVEGLWTHSPRPGVLLASQEYVDDNTFFSLGLRDVLAGNVALS